MFCISFFHLWNPESTFVPTHYARSGDSFPLYGAQNFIDVFSFFFYSRRLADSNKVDSNIVLAFILYINIEDFRFEGLYLFKLFYWMSGYFHKPFSEKQKNCWNLQPMSYQAIYNIVKMVKIVNFLHLTNALFQFLLKLLADKYTWRTSKYFGVIFATCLSLAFTSLTIFPYNGFSFVTKQLIVYQKNL